MIVVCGCLDVERVNGPGGEPEISSKNPPHTSVLVREFRVHGHGSAYRHSHTDRPGAEREGRLLRRLETAVVCSIDAPRMPGGSSRWWGWGQELVIP